MRCLVVLLTVATAAFSGGATASPLPLPGPGPRPRAGTVAGLGRAVADRHCERCHAAIAAEWRGSLHRRAWRDPVFQSAYRVEPLAFCRGCHAPESDPAHAPDAAARAAGIGCMTCHVAGGHVVGVRASDEAPHPLLADARLATVAACAGCHQFDFPPAAHQRRREAMQDTVAEHARSSRADEPCQSCHMPVVVTARGRHRSHAFRVLADPTLLRRAVTVSAARARPTEIELTLAAGAVGHAVPTGDMFRRLEVRATVLDARGRRRGAPIRTLLERRFRDRPRDAAAHDFAIERATAEDRRIPPPGVGPPRQLRLALPDWAATARVRYEVVYQRMSTPMASAFGIEQVRDEIVIAAGELPPPQLAAANPPGG